MQIEFLWFRESWREWAQVMIETALVIVNIEAAECQHIVQIKALIEIEVESTCKSAHIPVLNWHLILLQVINKEAQLKKIK